MDAAEVERRLVALRCEGCGTLRVVTPSGAHRVPPSGPRVRPPAPRPPPTRRDA